MSKVAYIIQQLLAREGKAFLPHFGVLTMQRSASVVDTSHKQIHPPSDSLHFMYSEFILTEHLTAQLQKIPFSKKTEHEKLAKAVESFFQSAMQKDEFSIGDFAYFVNTESGEFELKSKNDSIISPIGDLPVLDLPVQTAAPKAVKDLAAVEAIKPEKEEERKKKRAWLLPTLLTLLILLISFGLWWFTPDLRNGGEGFSKLLVKEERVNISPSEIEDKESNIAPIEEDSTYTSSSEKNQNEALQENGLPADTATDSNNSEEGPKEDDHNQESEEVGEFEVDDNCVIVVGAFSKGYNVDRMKKRLQNEGYDVFTQDKNGLTRVGLYSSCVNDKLDSVLRVARKEIEQAAWILE